MPAAFLIGGVPLAVGTYLAVLSAIVGTGFGLAKLLAPSDASPMMRAALVVALGFVGTFVCVLLAGYVHGLRPGLLVVLALVGVACAVASRGWSMFREIRVQRPGPLSLGFLGLSAALLAVIALCAVYAPAQPDEVAYHWATPLFWAHRHHWLASPNVSSNGPAFVETIYTAAATVGSSTAAHWIQETFLILIGGGAAALGEKLGLSKGMCFAAAITVPLFVKQAPLAYSDLAHGGMLLTAVAVLASCSISRRTLLTAGILTAAAGSVKIFGFAEAAFVVPVLIVRMHAGQTLKLRRLASSVMTLVTIPALALLYWVLRSYAFIGHAFDRSGAVIVHSSIDPSLNAGAAAGRVPTLLDVVKLPFVPLATGIIGQQEPYGGRTGAVLLLSLPISIVMVVRCRGRGLMIPVVLLLSAYVGYDVIAIVLVKTRFNAWVWPVMIVATLAIIFRDSAPGVRQRLGCCVLVLSVLQGADSVRVITRRPLVSDHISTAVTATGLLTRRERQNVSNSHRAWPPTGTSGPTSLPS